MSRIALINPRRMINDDVWQEFWGQPFGLSVSGNSLDMYETDSEVVVKIEAAGFTKDNVEISVENNNLTISGRYEQVEEKEDKAKKFYHKEIKQESFTRSVALPSKVQAENATAEFKDGVITITLPKLAEETAKKITIK